MAPTAAHQNAQRAGAIVLATGEATDTGGFDPLWAPLAGLPLLAWSVAAFERAPDIAEIVLLVSPDRQPDAVALAAARDWRRTRVLAAPDPHLPALLRLALAALSPTADWIVVHDAARPLISPELIAAALVALVPPASSRLLSRARYVPAGTLRRPGAAAPIPPSVGASGGRPPTRTAPPDNVGELPAVPEVAAASIPVNETLKRVQHGIVVETPPRAQLALLQTPQVFSRAALLAALDAFDSAPARRAAPADAASLAVAAGLRVALFPGAPTNIRVATPADLALAEALLSAS